MPLDPQVQVLLEQMAALNVPAMHTQTPASVREAMKMQMAMLGSPQPIAHIENRSIPVVTGEIPIRIYFFGMDAILDKSKLAMAESVQALQNAFNTK